MIYFLYKILSLNVMINSKLKGDYTMARNGRNVYLVKEGLLLDPKRVNTVPLTLINSEYKNIGSENLYSNTVIINAAGSFLCLRDGKARTCVDGNSPTVWELTTEKTIKSDGLCLTTGEYDKSKEIYKIEALPCSNNVKQKFDITIVDIDGSENIKIVKKI